MRATARPGSRVRTANWLMHMALPMLALWLLLDKPKVDLEWDNRVAHFVLVLSAALVSVVLGALIGREARARDDARLWLVSLVFTTTAGFFGVHALFTPGVLMDTSDAEFMLPTRMGLVLAGAIALASSITFTPARSARLWSLRRRLSALVLLLMAACAVLILCGMLDRLPDQALLEGTEQVGALFGCALFAAAALAYFPIYRRRPAVVIMSVLTAFVLLAEASVALALGMSWHASWWLWHLLMTMAFCFIAYSARVQFRREGRSEASSIHWLPIRPSPICAATTRPRWRKWLTCCSAASVVSRWRRRRRRPACRSVRAVRTTGRRPSARRRGDRHRARAGAQAGRP